MRIEAVKIEGTGRQNLTGLSADDVVALVQAESFAWIDIDISHTSEQALKDLLVDKLDFHPATVADCFAETPYHQPKIDEEPKYKFITFIYFESRGGEELVVRELNIYLGASYVITVHRHPLDGLLESIRTLPRHIAEYQQKAILFTHHVLDMVTDTFKKILKEIQGDVDSLELSVLKPNVQRMVSLNPFSRQDHLTDMRRILRSRQAIVMLRKTIQVEQRIVGEIIDDYDYEGASESSQEIAIYLRDIADHLGKYLEIVEAEDGALNHLMEVHHLVSNYRTNEIVVILTVMSTIMLPLNLIVGFFGMNFDKFSMFHTGWGIWAVLASMVGFVAMLGWYFRIKGWI